jgi:hypothetical protein
LLAIVAALASYTFARGRGATTPVERADSDSDPAPSRTSAVYVQTQASPSYWTESGERRPLMSGELNLDDEYHIGSSWLKYFDVYTLGREVYVFATAVIMDREVGNRYVWSLRVADQANPNHVYFQHHYVAELFRMPAGEILMHPEFSEWLRLPPGRYQVWIGLSDLPVGVVDLKFDDPEWAESHTNIKYMREITVED